MTHFLGYAPSYRYWCTTFHNGIPIAAPQARNFGPYCTRMTCRWSRSIYRLKGNTSRSADFAIFIMRVSKKSQQFHDRWFYQHSFRVVGAVFWSQPRICICPKKTGERGRNLGWLEDWVAAVIDTWMGSVKDLVGLYFSHLSSEHSSIHLYFSYYHDEDYGWPCNGMGSISWITT